MPTLTVTKSYADNTVLTEAQLDAMKTSLETFFNSTKIDDDNIQIGGISQDKLTATTQQFLVPRAAITPFAGASLPSGWLWCDGSAVSRTTYDDLFTAIATSYGVGDGSTTFNLPDVRGRVPTGIDDMDNAVGTGGGDASRLSDATFASGSRLALGSEAGDDVHTLIEAEMDQHNHGITDPGHTHSNTLSNNTIAADDHNHASGTYAAAWHHSGGDLFAKTISTTTWASNVDRDATGSGPGGASWSDGIDVQGSSSANSDTTDVAINNVSQTTSVTTDNTGSSTAHNNLQPLQLFNYIIKY
ncbi:MAG: tail fiber protein [Candidatus Peribacteraceae bacterium]|nr:tail fiber protein [Candidatus Peribacteraceae bacterium]